MTDLLTSNEILQLGAEAQASAATILRDEGVCGAEFLATEIGNNTSTAILASIEMLLPSPDEVAWQTARSSVWANEENGVGRAGLFSSQLNALQRTIADGSADNALAALEGRLYALFVAVRKLRRTPVECRFTHTVITDAHGHLCTRCGERVE